MVVAGRNSSSPPQAISRSTPTKQTNPAKDICSLAFRKAVINKCLGNSHRSLNGVSWSSWLAHGGPENTTMSFLTRTAGAQITSRTRVSVKRVARWSFSPAERNDLATLVLPIIPLAQGSQGQRVNRYSAQRVRVTRRRKPGEVLARHARGQWFESTTAHYSLLLVDSAARCGRGIYSSFGQGVPSE